MALSFSFAAEIGGQPAAFDKLNGRHQMLKALLLGTAITLGVATSANAVTVFSDNFESDAGAINATLNNWTVTEGTVDLIPVGADFNWCGSNCVDMNGSTQQEGRIESNLSLALEAGKRYILSFDYGINQNSSSSLETLKFGVGSNFGTLNVTGVSGLSPFVYSFLALADETVSIFFQDISNTPNDNGGPLLDNVKFAAVPVPAALPLLLTGLLGVGLLGRRRRNRS